MRIGPAGVAVGLVVTTFSAVAAEPAAGQGREPGAQATELQEVIVSAQRREQLLQDVPISVTVVNGEALEKVGARGMQDVFNYAVNVDAAEDGSASNNVDLTIRGVRPLFDGNQNTYGVFYDGFNISPMAIDLAATGSTSNNALVDVERIEILRGPQGTFFGRNVMGGAVSVVTRKPDGTFSFKGSLDASSFDTLDLRAMVNVPLRDNLFVRLSGQRYSTDGAVTNYGPGRSLRFLVKQAPSEFPKEYFTKKWDQSSSWTEVDAARLAVRYVPSERTTLDFTYTYNLKERGPYNSVPIQFARYDPGDPAAVATAAQWTAALGTLLPDPLHLGYFPNNQSRIALSDSNGSTNRTQISTLTLNHRFDAFTVESIIGYIDSYIDSDRDRDASLALSNARSQLARVDSFSQEIRAYSSWDKSWNWLFGVMHASDTDDSLRVDYWPGGSSAFNARNVVLGTPAGDALQPSLRGFNRTLAEFQTRSVFGELSWDITKRFDVSVGARYAQDDSQESGANWTVALARTDTIPVSYEGSSVSPKVSLGFDVTDDLKIYGTAARGYRPGGTNSISIINQLQAIADQFNVQLNISPAFQEETLTNYEIGAKGRFFDNRLQVNVAVFTMDYEDLQVQTDLPLPPGLPLPFFELTQNAADAKIKGIELEFTSLLTSRLELGGGVGLMDANFGKFQFLNGDGSVFLDISGNPLPRSRDWSAFLSGTYSYPINTNWHGYVRADVKAVPKTIQDMINPYPTRNTTPNYPSYEVANLRFGFDSERYSIQAYINNIFDEAYFTSYKHDDYGATVDVHPRTYGLRVTMNFGSL